jgi:hypothetical protein
MLDVLTYHRSCFIGRGGYYPSSCYSSFYFRPSPMLRTSPQTLKQLPQQPPDQSQRLSAPYQPRKHRARQIIRPLPRSLPHQILLLLSLNLSIPPTWTIRAIISLRPVVHSLYGLFSPTLLFRHAFLFQCSYTTHPALSLSLERYILSEIGIDSRDLSLLVKSSMLRVEQVQSNVEQ